MRQRRPVPERQEEIPPMGGPLSLSASDEIPPMGGPRCLPGLRGLSRTVLGCRRTAMPSLKEVQSHKLV